MAQCLFDVRKKHTFVWTGLFLPPAKQVKHTVAMAPRHMGKQRRWGREGTKGWWPASASTASCSVGQANRVLAAGYLLDRSDLIRSGCPHAAIESSACHELPPHGIIMPREELLYSPLSPLSSGRGQIRINTRVWCMRPSRIDPINPPFWTTFLCHELLRAC